jgi:hypothetical protein
MQKSKPSFNVRINQCAECNNFSQVNVQNTVSFEEMAEVEEEIRARFDMAGEESFYSEYQRMNEVRGFKGNEYHGTMTMKFKKFVVYAEVEFHKCCGCGGNY